MDILSVLSAIGGVGGLATIIALAYWLGGKFREIDLKFANIEKRFEQIDERFTDVDRRFEAVEKRLDGVERELKRLDEKLDSRTSELAERISGLEAMVGRKLERLADAFVSYQEFLASYFVSEGVLKPEAARVALVEARNLMRLAVSNPFTREEWKRLADLLDKSEKEELSLEEAQELLELARKAVREYGEHPEAWKLHIYASMMLGLAYKRMKEQRQQK
ncbi:hypothetical protein [Infirmifilum sp. SLHALR2]|nr:MAG: hypothetical protein B7L53_09315 [Thermofilum sp. NZ13]